jgi:1-acyl-sn-glycerol-3-phosphate acyltransferase
MIPLLQHSNIPTAEADADRLPHPTRPNWLWRSLQVILRIVFIVWLRYRVRGLKHVPPEGGGLILVNHQSFLDPLLVQLGMARPVSWIGRENLFRVPLIGWIIRKTYSMPIKRESGGTAIIRESVRRMQHGFLVGIYPEGTRTSDGSVGPFKPGFVAMIRRGKLPVYPVGIAGAFHALPRGAWFLRPRKVRVVFGEPIPFEELEPLCARGREDELVQLAHDRVSAAKNEADEWLKKSRRSYSRRSKVEEE